MNNPTTNNLKIHREEDSIFLAGNLTHETVVGGFKQICQLFRQDPLIKINFKDVKRCDSSSLALLTALVRESQKRHLPLQFVQVPQEMHELANVSGITSFLPIYP